MTGRRLGNYEILEKIGQGGMGQVWRARDARLNRSVAVKVLPSEVAGDPLRRQRFEQEARALGALNHPNIVAIYDVGQSEGQSYLVSELVVGGSLRAVLERGPLPPRKVIELATQMAEAISAAHALGIIHRDLKPENIMLTEPHGGAPSRIKLLDFGLAKQNAPVSAPAGEGTATMLVSQAGMVLGTVGYMSPEQVRGEPVDARSDIFSLGCVLYEMATASRAFEGKSAADVMSAILKEEPPEIPAVRAALPLALDAIVRRCLEKDPAQRFQSAADLAFALRSISNLSVVQPAIAAGKPLRRRFLYGGAVIVSSAILFAAGYLVRGRLTPSSLPEFRRLTFGEGRISSARFTPDGRGVLYSANWDGGGLRTYLAKPGSPESRDLDLPGNRLLAVSSQGDLSLIKGPFFPDGSGTLVRGSVNGGQTRDLLERVTLADWSPDGSEMAVVRMVNGRGRLEYPIGNVLLETIWGPFMIRISPDGSRVAFTTYDLGSSIAIYVVERGGGKRRKLGVVSGQTTQVDASALCWSPDGREIWFHAFDAGDPNSIFAIGLDGKRRIVSHFPGRVALYDIAKDGRVLFSVDSGHLGIRALAPDESAERDLSCLETSELRGLSDDGAIVVANVLGQSGGEKGSIYLRHTDGSPPIRLGDGVALALSQDGKSVSGFASRAARTRQFFVMPTGAGETINTQIPNMRQGVVVGWLNGEQNYLAGGWKNGEKEWRLWQWDARAQTVRPITGKVEDDRPFLSPDRRWLLTECAAHDWCIFPVEGGEPRHITALTPHERPVGWRSDNRSIYIATLDDRNDFFRISIFDLETSRQTAWKEIHPVIAVDEVSKPMITPDGRAYAYNYTFVRSQLYLVNGIR